MPYQTDIIFNIVSALVGAAVSILFWNWCFTRCKENSIDSQPFKPDDAPVVLFEKPIKQVTLRDILSATRNFHTCNLISMGRTWVGPSYQALLADGSELIVQCLRSCVLSEHAFRSEMSQLYWIRHPNLVPLLGFAVLKNKQRLLLYKHMRNGMLSRQLSSHPASLDWHMRLRIAVGVARGLAWLHHGLETPIVHGHFSSSSILLDDFYEARITDAALSQLAKACPIMTEYFDEQVYLAPESTGLSSTTKGDVYAFGVVMLELVTGKEAVVAATGEADWCKLVDWVCRFDTTGRVDCIDQLLRRKGHEDEMLRFLAVGISCVATRPEERLPMHRVYQLVTDIAGANYRFEHFDEFPLLYRLDE